jgi:hypothetical protein
MKLGKKRVCRFQKIINRNLVVVHLKKKVISFTDKIIIFYQNIQIKWPVWENYDLMKTRNIRTIFSTIK